MTDKENMMIEDFFKQAAQQQIEDNGFTERVMKNLPDRKLDVARRLSQLWTLFCLVVAGVLFFADGDGSYRRDSRQPLEYPVVGGYRVSLPALSNSP